MKKADKHIGFRNDVYRIFFPYDYKLVNAVKEIPGRRFVDEPYNKHWAVPGDIDQAVIADFATKYEFELTEDALKHMSGDKEDTQGAQKEKDSSKKVRMTKDQRAAKVEEIENRVREIMLQKDPQEPNQVLVDLNNLADEIIKEIEIRKDCIYIACDLDDSNADGVQQIAQRLHLVEW